MFRHDQAMKSYLSFGMAARQQLRIGLGLLVETSLLLAQTSAMFSQLIFIGNYHRVRTCGLKHLEFTIHQFDLLNPIYVRSGMYRAVGWGVPCGRCSVTRWRIFQALLIANHLAG